MIKLLFTFLIAFQAFAQVGLRSPALVGQLQRPAAGGSDCPPSYSNAGGTGDRTASITAFASPGLLAAGTASTLINGGTSGETTTYFNVVDITGGGGYLRWDFGAAKKITQAKWYQSGVGGHGQWKWQGSSDAMSWTDIGSQFDFGDSATQTMTELSGNTTAYRYYQLVGVVGSSSSGPYLYEMEFELCEP